MSDYDAGSVLHRDLVKEIVDALRAEGLRVGFYHSVIDWHHDQYAYARSKQLPHPLKGKPYPNGQRDHAKYVEYLHAAGQRTGLQLRPGGHPVVGLQLAGFPGRGGLAGVRPDDSWSARSSRASS